MIRAVLDTNVLAPGLASDNTVPGELLNAWAKQHFELIVSEHLLAEVSRTLENAYFRSRFPPARRNRAVSRLRQSATFVAIIDEVHGVATHPEDDLVLATAVSGQADVLVTGDRQLLKLASYEGIAILNPRAFLDLLQRDPS